ncbi:MAG: NusG domain II-containing protein [Erysipelotrichaceae bacterium]|nr:NusG domain II-containing protein [Erysipelotrichaceae bacterium]
MKKADYILICILMVLSIGALVPLMLSKSSASRAVVQVRNKEVMAIDLKKDGDYTVEGSNGPVRIEVRNGSVRVTQENSPHHYCSQQGFVNSVHTPIVCLPNETVITIEGEDGTVDTVIS